MLTVFGRAPARRVQQDLGHSADLEHPEHGDRRIASDNDGVRR